MPPAQYMGTWHLQQNYKLSVVLIKIVRLLIYKMFETIGVYKTPVDLRK